MATGLNMGHSCDGGKQREAHTLPLVGALKLILSRTVLRASHLLFSL